MLYTDIYECKYKIKICMGIELKTANRSANIMAGILDFVGSGNYFILHKLIRTILISDTIIQFMHIIYQSTMGKMLISK